MRLATLLTALAGPPLVPRCTEFPPLVAQSPLRRASAPRLTTTLEPPSSAAAAAAAPTATKLAAIAAAPPSAAAFALASRLSTRSFVAAPWRDAFTRLMTDANFMEHGWARTAFKLEEKWAFAVGAYTMADVHRDVTLLPPQFVAHGVQWGEGIFNKPMEEGFSADDVDKTMDAATVVMLNAGFVVPTLAHVSLAMIDATQLPIWLNVYLSKPGLARSTQLHTDKQDVLLVQTTGRKRWRVYRPPPPADAPAHDPFARGKGTDVMEERPDDLLIDTVMRPGDVLYIPAGFPHETDTTELGGDVGADDDALAAQPSVHLTVGLDTHLWALSYAKLREVRARARPPVHAHPPPTTHAALSHRLPADTHLRWRSRRPASRRRSPAAPPSARCRSIVGLSSTRPRPRLPRRAAPRARRRRQQRRRRGGGGGGGGAAGGGARARRRGADDGGGARAVGRPGARRARRVARPRRRGAADARPPQGGPRHPAAIVRARAHAAATPTHRERQAFLKALNADMDELDASMASLDGWAAGDAAPEAEAAGFGGGGGGGGKGKAKAKKNKKKR